MRALHRSLLPWKQPKSITTQDILMSAEMLDRYIKSTGRRAAFPMGRRSPFAHGSRLV